MEQWLVAIGAGVPLAAHLAVTAIAYYDAGRIALDRRKWTAVVFFVPIFGLFAYLFERSELSYDPERDPYRGGGFNVHPSRADDTALPTGEREGARSFEESEETDSPSDRDPAEGRNES